MFDHLVSGTVIGKSAYDEPAMPKEVPLTKQNAIFSEGIAPELNRAPEDSGEWILRVQGVDKHGKTLTQNKYVDEMTYNNTAIGDEWPITSQA